jgi:uncharacterized phage protein (TIGR02220 family)
MSAILQLKQPEEKQLTLKEQAIDVLNFLNEKTGRNYRPVDINLSFIMARLKSGIEPEDLKSIVAMKAREWGGDEKMQKYLRPATLFNQTKCEQYYGELE